MTFEAWIQQSSIMILVKGSNPKLLMIWWWSFMVVPWVLFWLLNLSWGFIYVEDLIEQHPSPSKGFDWKMCYGNSNLICLKAYANRDWLGIILVWLKPLFIWGRFFLNILSIIPTHLPSFCKIICHIHMVWITSP